MKLKSLAGIVLLGSLLLAACSTRGPVRKITKGDELKFYAFSEPRTFEEGVYGGLLGGVRLQIIDGAYRIALTEGDSEIWWGQWGDEYKDIVIDVDVRHLSESTNNTFGVMCRVRGTVGQVQPVEPEVAFLATQVALSEMTPTPAPEATAESTAEATAEVTAQPTVEATEEATPEATPELLGGASLLPPQGDGYLFLIRSSGQFAILRSRGREVRRLVDWTNSDVIRPGPAKNHLRAACVGDYLALYVNDQFVGDVIDDTYTSGQVGLAAASSDRLGVRVEFDNLQISEGKQG